MKECPYCVEHIKDETFGFRYYGSDSTNWKKWDTVYPRMLAEHQLTIRAIRMSGNEDQIQKTLKGVRICLKERRLSSHF